MGLRYPNLPQILDAYLGGVRGRSAALARAVGVERSAITRWKNGEDPDVKHIKKLAAELGVTVGALAGDREGAQTQHHLDVIEAYDAAPEAVRAGIDAMLAAYMPKQPRNT